MVLPICRVSVTHGQNVRKYWRTSECTSPNVDGKGQNADFINCVAFGKQASFLEKFGKKGVKFIVTGRIQTGSYEKDGVKVYTTDVVIEELEFCESKRNDDSAPGEFMNIPDGIDDEVPFK